MECQAASLFFSSCTCAKVVFTSTFLKCRFRLKVEIISRFLLRTNVAFFLNQSHKQSKSIHVNKVSLMTWFIHNPQYNLKVKWLLVNKFNMILNN